MSKKNVPAHCMTELALGQPLAELTGSWSPYMEKTVVGHQWPKKVPNGDHSVGPTVQDPCMPRARENQLHYSANAQDVDTSLAWMRVKGSVNEHHIEHVTLCRTENC